MMANLPFELRQEWRIRRPDGSHSLASDLNPEHWVMPPQRDVVVEVRFVSEWQDVVE